MDVVARLERANQARILGQMSDATQLDLIVVGDQELPALAGHERGAKDPSPLGANRDVVQVRGIRAEPTGSGHRLIERRPNTVAGTDLGQQPLAVGAAELLELAVLEQVFDDRMLSPQLLERLCIGGVSRSWSSSEA